MIFLTPEISDMLLKLAVLSPYPGPAHPSRAFELPVPPPNRRVWGKQPVGYFFGSLHAVCMRLLRTALATRASSWVYKLSDIQRNGERIMLPRNLSLATCPGWETEKRDGVRPLADISATPCQLLPVTAMLVYIFILGCKFLLARVFWLISHLLSVFPLPLNSFTFMT